MAILPMLSSVIFEEMAQHAVSALPAAEGAHVQVAVINCAAMRSSVAARRGERSLFPSSNASRAVATEIMAGRIRDPS
ncbi:hypothetical protein ASE85_00225 [Sphingobium sp. Leaf26]|nr:hypothetical protein ASE85_00225 [Sphingobium sp. Leaf26]